MTEYQHILAAIDIYGDFEPVLNRALGARGTGSKLSLMYVIEPIYYTEIYDGGMLIDLHNKAKEKAREGLADICERFQLDDVTVLIDDGHSASKIHDAADAHNVDLIVIGSHGKHGLQLLLGSTANAVLHGAKCDVLAVRIPV